MLPQKKSLSDGFKELEDKLNSLFAGFELPSREFTDLDYRTPSMDLMDEGKTIRVIFEVPGIPKEDLNVEVNGRHLTLSAKTGEKKEEKTNNKYYFERKSSSFYRNILLPSEVDSNSVKAKLNNGILELTLTKITSKSSKKIKID